MKMQFKKVEVKDPELLELISEKEEAWLNSLSAEELIKYGGKYIATKRKQVVGAANSLEDLYRQLKLKGIKSVHICYIEEPGIVAIY